MKFTLFKKKEGDAPKKKRKKSDTEQIGSKANRDWEITLIAFIILNLVIGGAAAYFFNMVESGAIFASNEVFTETPDVDVAILRKITERYDARKVELEALKIDIASQIDPSR